MAHRFVATLEKLQAVCFRIDEGDGPSGTGFALARGLAFSDDQKKTTNNGE